MDTPLPPLPKAPKNSTGLALASMLCGLSSLVFVPLTAVVLGLPAVICGHRACGRIKRSHGVLKGKGFALAGLISGYFSLVVTAILITLVGGAALFGRSAWRPPRWQT